MAVIKKPLERGNFIMHVAGKNVAWEIVQVLAQTRTSVRLIIRPWNLGYTGRPWLVSAEDSVAYLQRSELADWRLLDLESMTEPRTEAGVPKADL